MVGNENAHQRLAEIINRLRQLRGHLGIPEALLERYYDEAIKLLSEVEAAMGSGKIPEELTTQHLRFSHDLINGLEHLMAHEEQHKRILLAHYMKECIDIFPQTASQAAGKFRLSPIAIMEAAERILKCWTRESVRFEHTGNFFEFYYLNATSFLPLMYQGVGQLGDIHVFERIAPEAFGEIIRMSIEESYRSTSSEINKILSCGLLGDWNSGLLIKVAFVEPFLHKFDNGTAEEKLAYSLLLHAVFRCFEDTIVQHRL